MNQVFLVRLLQKIPRAPPTTNINLRIWNQITNRTSFKAIVAQIGGKAQFNQWFLYVLLVVVVGTLLTEIIFLNVCLPSLLSV